PSRRLSEDIIDVRAHTKLRQMPNRFFQVYIQCFDFSKLIFLADHRFVAQRIPDFEHQLSEFHLYRGQLRRLFHGKLSCNEREVSYCVMLYAMRSAPCAAISSKTALPQPSRRLSEDIIDVRAHTKLRQMPNRFFQVYIQCFDFSKLIFLADHRFVAQRIPDFEHQLSEFHLYRGQLRRLFHGKLSCNEREVSYCVMLYAMRSAPCAAISSKTALPQPSRRLSEDIIDVRAHTKLRQMPNRFFQVHKVLVKTFPMVTLKSRFDLVVRPSYDTLKLTHFSLRYSKSVFHFMFNRWRIRTRSRVVTRLLYSHGSFQVCKQKFSDYVWFQISFSSLSVWTALRVPLGHRCLDEMREFMFAVYIRKMLVASSSICSQVWKHRPRHLPSGVNQSQPLFSLTGDIPTTTRSSPSTRRNLVEAFDHLWHEAEAAIGRFPKISQISKGVIKEINKTTTSKYRDDIQHRLGSASVYRISADSGCSSANPVSQFTPVAATSARSPTSRSCRLVFLLLFKNISSMQDLYWANIADYTCFEWRALARPYCPNRNETHQHVSTDILYKVV
ncbi:unnamed protein product, partial [Trichogramma brassicae]